MLTNISLVSHKKKLIFLLVLRSSHVHTFNISWSLKVRDGIPNAWLEVRTYRNMLHAILNSDAEFNVKIALKQKLK